MIIALPDGWAVTLSVLVWLVVCLAIGRLATSWPLERVATPGPITRLRAWERDGGWWIRHARVLRWKDRLPGAGAFFAGGYEKRSVRSRRTEDLARFRAETIRAERVHWSIMATSPVHLIWCRPTVAAGMLAFGVVFNAPFIVIQRANRGRLERVLRRSGPRRGDGPGSPAQDHRSMP